MSIPFAKDLRSWGKVGQTDDACLTAAIADLRTNYPANGKPAIWMPAGTSGPYAVGRLPENGVRLWAPDIATDQPRGGDPYSCQVKIQGDGAWWDAKDNHVTDFSIEHITINGQKGETSVLANTARGGFYSSVFAFCAANHRMIVGTALQQALFTASAFRGYTNWNNCTDGIYNIGGSDNFLWTEGNLYADSPAGWLGAGDTLCALSYLSKSQVANHYITAEGPVIGLRATGSDNTFGTTVTGCVVEGRTASNPATYNTGTLILQAGGDYGYVGVVTNYCTPTRGVVTINSGRATFTQHVYGKGSTAESVPLYVVSGGELSTMQVRRGGTWTGLPRVQNAGGEVVHDDSVSVS